jgi:hypothetical protein
LGSSKEFIDDSSFPDAGRPPQKTILPKASKGFLSSLVKQRHRLLATHEDSIQRPAFDDITGGFGNSAAK